MSDFKNNTLPNRISKKTFIEVINLIKEQKKINAEISEGLEKLIDGWAVLRENKALTALLLILKEEFGPVGYDYIDWWLWENAEKKVYYEENGVRKEKDLSNIEDLYDYIVSLKDEDDFISETYVVMTNDGPGHDNVFLTWVADDMGGYYTTVDYVEEIGQHDFHDTIESAENRAKDADSSTLGGWRYPMKVMKVLNFHDAYNDGEEPKLLEVKVIVFEENE